jgi:hypothetical protein
MSGVLRVSPNRTGHYHDHLTSSTNDKEACTGEIADIRTSCCKAIH